MSFYDCEVIAKAKEMDLLTYLQNYSPQELVHVSGNIYCTKAHDSLRISNGKWCWFSQGIGGRSALDYLIKVNGLSFLEAVEAITGKTAVQPPVFTAAEKEKPKTLLLPQASRCATHAVSYLEARGISFELIDFCIQTGRLYESTPYHNAVFVGFDKEGKQRYACQRGIGTDFKGDVNGSDKHYSFALPAQRENQAVHLFESAIDLLSYATLCQRAGRDWQRENLLSLAGIYQPKRVIEESKIPAALTRFLEDYPHIKTVVLHLDNDGPGRLATKAIMTAMPKEYTVLDRPPPEGKDVNDYLCRLKQRQSERSFER
ncbi:MAG: DUF3991 and TOPRIM domain-containing protein [Oscillospiraceae bacterium]|nr:DUF3991 and TOPRIM domain-containing protein [Oscillospiraceae bacterium]